MLPVGGIGVVGRMGGNHDGAVRPEHIQDRLDDRLDAADDEAEAFHGRVHQHDFARTHAERAEACGERLGRVGDRLLHPTQSNQRQTIPPRPRQIACGAVGRS
jgi:hypothetical protein